MKTQGLPALLVVTKRPLEEKALRATTLLRKMIWLPKTVIESVQILDDGNLQVTVRPHKAKLRCSVCSKPAPRYDKRPVRRWRHLSIGKVVVYLAYAPCRVHCRRCERVVAQQLPWAVPESRCTRSFEEQVAFHAQHAPQSFVAQCLGVSWRTVGRIVSRVVKRSLDADRLSGLRRIGIDEFSYRKRHRYLVVVVDHDTGHVVWMGEGRSAQSLGPFFDLLGNAGCEALQTVTMDMSAGFERAVRQRAAGAEIVFDRFHVQQLCSRALDETRRSLVREMRGTRWAKDVKNLRYLLLRHGEALSLDELDRLEGLQRNARSLYRAYERKEELVAIFDEHDPAEALPMLKRWLGWAARSKLKHFIKTGQTIKKHMDGVIAYFDQRLTNGLVEGVNNKIRVAARRAYGFHSAGALMAMVYLIAGGVSTQPDLPKPSLN